MNTRSINPKFFNFLAISKDIAMTEGVKRKIKSSLSLESEEITEIKQILYSPKARVDDYEFAYNYFDRELNLLIKKGYINKIPKYSIIALTPKILPKSLLLPPTFSTIRIMKLSNIK